MKTETNLTKTTAESYAADLVQRSTSDNEIAHCEVGLSRDADALIAGLKKDTSYFDWTDAGVDDAGRKMIEAWGDSTLGEFRVHISIRGY